MPHVFSRVCTHSYHMCVCVFFGEPLEGLFSMNHWELFVDIMTLHHVMLQHSSSKNKNIFIHNYNIIITLRKFNIGILCYLIYTFIQVSPIVTIISFIVVGIFLFCFRFKSNGGLYFACNCHISLVSFNQNSSSTFVRLLWHWHFWRAQANCFSECPSNFSWFFLII